MAETPLLTSAEIADRFRVSQETVRRWHREGILPGFRIGNRGHFKFRTADVEALVGDPEDAA